MQKFNSITEAFDWWVKHFYPNLPPDKKKGKTLQGMQDYIYGRGVSEKRMTDILEEHGHFHVQTIVIYTP